MNYPSTKNLWKRDDDKRIKEGQCADPAFASISRWHVTEKIDGMNIRIDIDQRKKTITFGGRTFNAQLPEQLISHLTNNFPTKKTLAYFKDNNNVILFGEGYGGKIQRGKGYSKDERFILFDVWIDGWWLEPHSVKNIARNLDIPYVPDLGTKSIKAICALVQKGFPSKLNKQAQAEGIVARSHPLLLFRNGTPVMFKLKTKDYDKLRP